MLGKIDIGDEKRALEFVVEVANFIALLLGLIALRFDFLFAGEGGLPLIEDAGEAEQGDEEHGGGAVDVGRGGERFAVGGLLGGHVVGRAYDLSGLRGIAICGSAVSSEDFGQSEIGDVRSAVGIEKNIGGFEVAMEDAALVG